MAKAIVFDFDGTLLDTEPLHDEALLKILGKAGVKTTLAELRKCTGVGVKGTIERFKLANGGKDVSWEQVAQEFSDSLLPNTLASQPFDGALETVRSLSQKFPMAIASNSHKPVVRAGLEKNGLLEYFKAVVTREDCVNGKPDAEPYLKACSALGFAPSECVAVEDSPTGLASALAAGCKTIAFTAQNAVENNLRTRIVFATNSLADITPELVAKL